MKRFFDVYVQCAKCNEENHPGYVDTKEPQIGEETYRCSKCADKYEEKTGLHYGRFIVSLVSEDQSFSDRDELIEWYTRYTDYTPYDKDFIDDYFDWDEESGQHVPNEEIEVISLTVMALPPWEMPGRDWYTLAEIPELINKGEEGIRSDWKRGKFDEQKLKGYVQYSGATALIHKKAIESVYGVEVEPIVKPIKMKD